MAHFGEVLPSFAKVAGGGGGGGEALPPPKEGREPSPAFHKGAGKETRLLCLETSYIEIFPTNISRTKQTITVL